METQRRGLHSFNEAKTQFTILALRVADIIDKMTLKILPEWCRRFLPDKLIRWKCLERYARDPVNNMRNGVKLAVALSKLRELRNCLMHEDRRVNYDFLSLCGKKIFILREFYTEEAEQLTEIGESFVHLLLTYSHVRKDGNKKGVKSTDND